MHSAGIASLTLFGLLAGAMAYADEGHFERTLPAEPRGAVEISNVSGEIDVRGWDRPEVSVRAELGEGVERVDVTSEHGRTIIKVVLPSFSGHRGEAHLQVQIPKESELTVSAVSADVKSSGVLGTQRLNAVSGDVNAELGNGDLELKTVSGDVKLRGRGHPARLHVTTVSGDVRLEHGAGELEASTVSGTLFASLDTATSIRARSTSGDLHFEGRLSHGGSVDVSSVSGEIQIRLPAEGGYTYEVTTFSGDISDCFDVKSERSSRYGPGHTLQGTRGDGAGHVRLKSMSGDVQLCDRR
jgi:DUF4097 and DUF4098 domain-containing protein YvlB